MLLIAFAGCAKYNTYFNAKRSFDNAERVRDDAIRKNQDPPKPVGQQKADYEMAVAKAQKVLDSSRYSVAGKFWNSRSNWWIDMR